MKLAFWKKDDPLPDLSTDFNPPASTPSTPDSGLPPLGSGGGMPDLGASSMPSMPTSPASMGMPANDPFGGPSSSAFSAPMAPEPAPPAPPMQQGPDQDMRIELILARLDSIRNQLETLNQRMANLERSSIPQQGAQARGPWYTPKQ